MTLTAVLKSLFGMSDRTKRRHEKTFSELTAERIQERLNPCPACERDVRSHTFALLGVFVLPGSGKQMTEAIKERRWHDLHSFQHEPTQDMMDLVVLFCQDPSKALLVEVYDPVSYDESVAIHGTIVLDENERKVLEGFLKAMPMTGPFVSTGGAGPETSR